MAKMANVWTEEQNDAIVADYFAMLADDIAGRPYSKAEHNRLLQAAIGRPRSSIEYKHQNISAVLKGLGDDWIPGYKPAFNFQASLVDAVVRWLDRHPDWVVSTAQVAMDPSQTALREEAILWIGPPPTHRNAPPPNELEQMTAIRRDDGLAFILRTHDRTAEVARQRRAEFRDAGVVFRQAGEPVRRRTVFGAVEFGRRLAGTAIDIECSKQRGHDGDGADAAERDEHFARQTRDARLLGPQAQFGVDIGGRWGRCVCHQNNPGLCPGLPSVRTIRTRFSLSLSPSLSSAAAKRRSTT